MSATWTICWMLLALAGVCRLEESKDPAANQLPEYAQKNSEVKYIVRDSGQPIDSLTDSLQAGKKNGPLLLQDTILLEELSAFDRERIPERAVHAKGAGAYGYFEVTHDITKYTKAKVFEEVGKKTDIFVRFSPVVPERGGSELTRNPRGFSIKFYTEEGNWDQVGLSVPVFTVRDPYLFIHVVHSQKRNPQTNLLDRNMFWDFITLRPEAIHQTMLLFGEQGIPDGYRHMDGFGINTYKLVNKENKAVYVKFHYRTDQGFKGLSNEQAANISGTDPDYFTRDLYNAIEKKEYPTWTFYIQVMTYEQAEKFRWNPFDDTKIWPENEFPLIPVGKIVLNRNPLNYFAEVEQIAYCPANLVPGIESSPDIVLQDMFQELLLPSSAESRLVQVVVLSSFSILSIDGMMYLWRKRKPLQPALVENQLKMGATALETCHYSDAQNYRLGVNHRQLPINVPHGVKNIHNYNRDGKARFYSQGAAPNYYPNSFSKDVVVPSAAISEYYVQGEVKRYEKGDDDNYSQPALLWEKVLTDDERQRLVDNISNDVKQTTPEIQVRLVKVCEKVNKDFGKRIAEKLGISLQ